MLWRIISLSGFGPNSS
uniref:Uncharacterized protein n=1 Tax=Arundo donax TaxID=35708 RepID=A0A0A9BP28_ARUDO